MITRSSHLPAALASPMAEVAAIVDPVLERAGELARSYGLDVQLASRVEDVLDRVDGAVIATPNDTHTSLALACLRERVPVLIEKPLAGSSAEGAAIVDGAEAAGQVVAVGYTSRFRPAIVLLKTLLDQGYFGAVRRFAHQFGTAGGWAPFSAYNLKRDTAGGGVLVVTGTHFLDRMLHLWGYPDEAALTDDSLGGPEANCTASFRYRRAGATVLEGVARYSKTAPLPAGLVIETERGHVVLGDTDESEIVFRSHAHPSVEEIVRSRTPARLSVASMAQAQLEDFIEACRAKRPPRVDGRQALQSLELIEQLYRNRVSIDIDWYAPDAEQAAA
jgi:UDP-N-acetyl-2-amino-2-deoxyglucuronate dehydrogenase